MNEKLWECPRCGTQMTSPESVYQAVCACLTYAGPIYLGQGDASMPVVMETTNMVDITPRHRPGEIVAVPDNPGELLLKSRGDHISRSVHGQYAPRNGIEYRLGLAVRPGAAQGHRHPRRAGAALAASAPGSV